MKVARLLRWGRLARAYPALAVPSSYDELTWLEEKALWQVLADEAAAIQARTK